MVGTGKSKEIERPDLWNGRRGAIGIARDEDYNNGEGSSSACFTDATFPQLSNLYEEMSLEEIRLVKLAAAPNDESAIIECSMEKMLFHKTPCYTALSYCWGSKDGPEIIL
jgi:hypothetical protein